MRKLTAALLVVGLVALAVPAVAMAAGPNTNFGQQVRQFVQNMKEGSQWMNRFQSTTASAVGEHFGKGYVKGLADRNRERNKVIGSQSPIYPELLAALSNLTGSSTTALENLMKTYHVNWEKVVLAYSITQVTTATDTVESVIQKMPHWQAYIKSQGVATADVMKKFQENMKKVTDTVRPVAQQMAYQYKEVLWTVTASVLGTTTTALAETASTYDVGIDRIIMAYAVANATTATVAPSDVLTYMANHNLKDTLSYFGVSTTDFLNKVKVYLDGIVNELKAQGISLPKGIADLYERLSRVLSK
ncbi:hypothetical protein HPY42_01390 [Coprothermobacteraceae bacterium]|nr:hypothetical protein [Coprothermobacteraceae bacterium]